MRKLITIIFCALFLSFCVKEYSIGFLPHSGNFIKRMLSDARNENNSSYLFLNIGNENVFFPTLVKSDAVKWYYFPGKVDEFIPEYVDTLKAILNRDNRKMYINISDTTNLGDLINKVEYSKLENFKNHREVRLKYFKINGAVRKSAFSDDPTLFNKELNAVVAFLINNNYLIVRTDLSGEFLCEPLE